MKTKICKGCNKELSIDKFTKNKVLKDGYENKCRDCRRKQRATNHHHSCEQCNRNFTSARKDAKFCSRQCLGDSRKKSVYKTCQRCGSTFETQSYLSDTAKFCDITCKSKWQSENMEGENNHNYNRIKTNCSGCEKEILVVPSRINKYVFCSSDCHKKNIGRYQTGELNVNYKRKTFVCYQCGKQFEDQPAKHKGNHCFCSMECTLNWRSEENKKRTVERVKTTCATCDKTLYRTASFIADRKHIYCSVKCKDKGNSLFYSGENHPLYKKDKTEQERIVGRKYLSYYNWRKAVYERDNYTCQICKDSSGGNLVAHHLDGYTGFPEKRTELDNGITLCKKCHLKFHNSYGYKNPTKTQFIHFLKHTNTEPSLAETLGRCND